VGNAGDRRAMEAAAKQKLGWMKTQILSFKPKHVLPFASFSYFSHQDNWYLNEGMNRIGPVTDFIRHNTAAEPVVLYPGDCWEFSDSGAYDCSRALERYAQDYERVQREGYPHKSRKVSLEKLLEHGNAFAKKLRLRNGALVSVLLPPATIFLQDHNQAVCLSLRGLRSVSRDKEDCDLICNSDALDYCFLWEWGGRTLDINGRFDVPAHGQYWRFKMYATLASFNSRGEGLKETVRTVQRRVFKVLRTVNLT
jgi:hypothetical protein